MKISIDVFDSKSIDKAIKQLEDYKNDLNLKAQELCKRLAVGADLVRMSIGIEDLADIIEDLEQAFACIN